MRPVHLLLVVTLFLAPGQFAQALDKEALRMAAKPPSFTIPWTIVTSHDGFCFPHEQTRAWTEKRIRELTAQMKGDAGDAELHYALGCLDGDGDRTIKAYCEAARLYLQRVRARPNDGYAAAKLGVVCFHFRMLDEAETLHRRAVEVAPDDWRTWAALSTFLDNARADKLLTKGIDDLLDGADSLEQRLAATSSLLARAKAILAESRACCEKAIALAPREPLTYLRRVKHLWLIERLLMLSAAVGNPAAKRQILLQGTQKWTLEIAADVEKMAELDPSNCTTVAGAAFFSLMANVFAAVGDPEFASEASKREFIEKKRLQPVFERAQGRLAALTRDKDPARAARAAESLGALCESFNEFGASLDPAPWLRLAVEADPTRDLAWLLLIRTDSQDERQSVEAIALCKKRLALSESAVFRFLHGKILAKRDELALAAREYRVGLQHDASNLWCRIGRASVLIRRGDEAGLKEAADQLRQAAEIAAKSKPPASLLSDLHATFAIAQALQGQEQSARESLGRAFENVPDHDLASSVYNIVCDIPAGPPAGSLPDPKAPRMTVGGERFETLPGPPG